MSTRAISAEPAVASLLLVALLSGCVTVPDGGDGGDDGVHGDPVLEPDLTWIESASPEAARGEAACAVDDGSLLLAGGFVDGPGNQVTASVEVYDRTSDAWSPAPDLPTPVHHTQVAAVDGTFYVLGGYVGPGFTPTNGAWSWTPGEEDWSMVASLPVARGAGGAAVADGRVVLAGGVGADGELIAQVDLYDPANDTWRQGPELPTPRDHLAVAAVGDTVVAANGRMQSFETNTERVETWNTSRDAWTRGVDAPTARGGLDGTAWNGTLVVAGGEESGGTFDEAEAYEPGGNWSRLPAMPTARHGLCVAAMADGVHTVTGGREPGFAVSDVHEVLVVENGTAG